jgi:uncharacterized protein (TIGR02444 family)
LRGTVLVSANAASEGFWRFSLMVYSRPGLAEALIRLQDRNGHNVNLILFGLWLGFCEAVRLDATGLASARAVVAGLDRGVVAPLRELRRALKDDPAPDVRDLRHRVLALEIAAERCVQARLASYVVRRRKPPTGDRRTLAEENLRLILAADFASEETALLLRAIIAL